MGWHAAADQKVLVDHGAKAEARRHNNLTRLIETGEKEAVARGMQFVQMGDTQKAKIKRVK